jgi:hypothetical protein
LHRRSRSQAAPLPVKSKIVSKALPHVLIVTTPLIEESIFAKPRGQWFHK